MLDEKNTSAERPVPQRRGRRWLLAIVLGLCTWWGLGWWLQPRPLWQLHFADDKVAQRPFCEDETGSWLLTSQRETVAGKNGRQELATVAYHVLDAKTGKTVNRLDRPEHSLSNEPGSILIELDSIRIIENTLWRCVRYKQGNELRFELRAWHFTKDDKEQIVQQWNVPESTPFDIHFASKSTPYFVVMTEWPWQPAIVPLFIDGWVGVTNVLALGSGKKGMSAIIPWARTYRLESKSIADIKLSASWTLPPLRWSKPALGPELRWIAFGDARLNDPKWEHTPENVYCKKMGILIYDGMTGNQTAVVDDRTDKSRPQESEAWGDMVRIRNLLKTDGIDRLYDVTSKRFFAWPVPIKTPPDYLNVKVDQLNQHTGVYKSSPFKEDEEYHYVHWTDSGIECYQIPPLEYEDYLELHKPVCLQGNSLAFFGVTKHQPKPMTWLAKQGLWLHKWVNTFWPTDTSGWHFFDISTGKKVGEINHVEGTGINSSKHFYTWTRRYPVLTGSSGDQTLECWTIPFRFYSAWWNRGAGLLVFLVILIVRRGSRPLLSNRS